MRKILALLFISVLIISACVIPASAVDYGCDVETSTHAIYLKNLNTGDIIVDQNSDEVLYPASLTKIMTYLVVSENVDDYDNTFVQITEDMFTELDPESSVMGLTYHIGEKFSIRDLLYGMMVSSGNDAAVVLAGHVGGTVSDFVKMMNDKAAALGLVNTHFVNPHGLHDDQHYTTAKELSVITEEAMKDPDFITITNTVEYKPSNFNEPITTTNYLLDKTEADGYYYYENAKGIKTGYTDEAGKCLVSTADNGEYQYLMVELKSPFTYDENINYAMIDAKNLYTWCYDNIGFVTLKGQNEAVDTLPVKYVWGDVTTDLVASEGVSALLPKNYSPEDVKIDVKSDGVVEAPVKAGDKLGTCTVSFKGEEIGTVDLVASEDINSDFTNVIYTKITDFAKNNPVLAVIIGIIVLLLIILIIIFVRMAVKNKKSKDDDYYDYGSYDDRYTSKSSRSTGSRKSSGRHYKSRH